LGGFDADAPRAARWLPPLALFAAAIALIAIRSLPALCPLRLVCHLPCPTCGLTRATRLALAGNLAAATRLHPLWPLVLAWTLGVGCLQFTHHVRTGAFAPLATHRFLWRTGKVLLVALVVVWVARFLGGFGGRAPV
jgi:hypothetical protein